MHALVQHTPAGLALMQARCPLSQLCAFLPHVLLQSQGVILSPLALLVLRATLFGVFIFTILWEVGGWVAQGA